MRRQLPRLFQILALLSLPGCLVVQKSTDEELASQPVPISGGSRRPILDDPSKTQLDCRYVAAQAGGDLNCLLLVPFDGAFVPAEELARGIDVKWNVTIPALYDQAADTDCTRGPVSFACRYQQTPPPLLVALNLIDTRGAEAIGGLLTAEVDTGTGAITRITTSSSTVGNSARLRIELAPHISGSESKVGAFLVTAGEDPPECTPASAAGSDLPRFKKGTMIDWTPALPAPKSEIYFCVSDGKTASFAETYVWTKYTSETAPPNVRFHQRLKRVVERIEPRADGSAVSLNVRLTEFGARPGYTVLGYVQDGKGSLQRPCLPETPEAGFAFGPTETPQSWNIGSLDTSRDYTFLFCFQPEPGRALRRANAVVQAFWDDRVSAVSGNVIGWRFVVKNPK